MRLFPQMEKLRRRVMKMVKRLCHILLCLLLMFTLLIPVSDRIHDVIVVPMLAPIIMPTACVSFIIPELTKPTTITVVAEELCITAVTPIPVIKALSLLPVSLPKSPLRLPPARLSRDSPIKFIPTMKTPTPASNHIRQLISSIIINFHLHL